MKVVDLTAVTFDASAKTLDFTAYSGFDIRRLYTVINLTRNVMIYGISIDGRGYTLLAGSVLTLTYNTTTMADADHLMVLYDDNRGIGVVTTDQTTHGLTDLVAADITKIGGATVAQGHGTAANALRVELSTDSTGMVALNGANFTASGKTPVASTFGATGSSAAFTPLPGRPFNASLSGAFGATVVLKRSFDSGSSWLPLTVGGVAISSYTAPISEVLEETESGVQYKFECTAYTSGTVTYRISQ